MSYAYAEPTLDFEDANAFLAALADTVPSIEKYSEWNKDMHMDPIDQLYTPMTEPKLEESSPEIVSSNGSIDEYFPQIPEQSDPMNFINPSNNLDFTQDRNSFNLAADSWLQNDATYENSLGSTMSPNIGFSPASAHSANTASSVSPGSYDFAIKQEPVLNNMNSVADPDFGRYGEFEGFSAEPDSKINSLFAQETQNAPAPEPAQKQIPKQETRSTSVAEIKPKVKGAKVTKPEKKPERRTKTSHNVIEKKYRTSINSKILELRDAVPTLKFASGAPRMSMADLDGLTPASKLNKASILTKANEYILHMEKKNKDLQSKIQNLQGLISQAEAGAVPLSRSSQSSQGSSVLDPIDDYSSYMPDYNTSGYLHQRRAAANPQIVDSSPTYAQFSDTNMRGVQSQPAPNVAGRPNLNVNMFLGGLAMLMGSSYVNDGNFQAMSALPFFPSSILGGSSSVSQLLFTLRSSLAFFGMAFMVYSAIGNFSFSGSKDQKSASLSERCSMLFSLLNPKSHGALESEEKLHIIQLITGKKSASRGTWLKCYLRLRNKEASFEVLLLRFLVGTLIIRKNFVFAKLVSFDLRFKKLALMSAEYSGDNANLKNIHRLFKNVDGLSIFESEAFAGRLQNLSSRKAVCHGVSNGENSSLIVDSILRNGDNFYGLIFEWRVLEIIHELTLVYLDLLASDSSEDEFEDLKSDTHKLHELIADSKYLTRQLSYFEMLLFPESSPRLLKQDKSYILDKLQAITSYNQEPELTDDESCSDDESVASADEVMTISQSNSLQSFGSFDLIRSNKSIVRTFSLMSEEKFIVLATSLISYSVRHEPSEKALDLLGYLNFDKSKTSISLLSFACILNLVSSVIKENDDGEEREDAAGRSKAVVADMSAGNQLILESLIKMMKGWLNDDRNAAILTTKLRNDLSSLVISKGIALNKL